MRKKLWYAVVFLLLPLTAFAQNPDGTGIEWFGENEIANDHVARGIGHFMNIEFAKSYTFMEAALDEDPSLFGPHVILAFMTRGDERADHKAQANKNVADKGEVSKLYVSLLDVPRGPQGAAARRVIWKKMYEAAPPTANLVHYYYALSLEDPQDTIAELKALLAEPNPNNRGRGHIHNILGYTYYAEGDKVNAKKHFDAYLSMSPGSYNAHDSMGEFFLLEGDLEQAKAHYGHARALFPMSQSANNKLKELETLMSDQGNLWLVAEETVPPEHHADYVQWSKEYKASADMASTDNFYVSSIDGNFQVANMVGKTLSEFEAFKKKRRAFRNDEALNAQFNKYKHSISSIKESLWRHNPAQSYNTGSATSPESTPYIKVIRGYVKFGHGQAVNELLNDIKTTWESAGISQPYNVFWNVMGEDGPVVVIRSSYESPEAWAADKQVEEIISAKMADLVSRWRSHMRRTENRTYEFEADLSHMNPVSLTSN